MLTSLIVLIVKLEVCGKKLSIQATRQDELKNLLNHIGYL
jgi:hypothetical protein